MAITRNTVDRLDKASSYTTNKVRMAACENCFNPKPLLTDGQTRKRKRHHRDEDHDMQEGAEPIREEEPTDKLANATTLYVGNL